MASNRVTNQNQCFSLWKGVLVPNITLFICNICSSVRLGFYMYGDACCNAYDIDENPEILGVHL